MTERVQLYEAGRNGKCMYDSQRAPAWRVTGGKKEAFQSNMGCFNTAPLEYRDALRLMRNLEPSRQNYCLLLLFEDFFSPWHVLLLERSQLLCYNCRCFCSYVHFKIERAQSCSCCQFKTSKEKNLCLFFIEMGLKCATFLPDECTDSAEMLTYIMTELSAHSLHPS